MCVAGYKLTLFLIEQYVNIQVEVVLGQFNEQPTYFATLISTSQHHQNKTCMVYFQEHEMKYYSLYIWLVNLNQSSTYLLFPELVLFLE